MPKHAGTPDEGKAQSRGQRGLATWDQMYIDYVWTEGKTLVAAQQCEHCRYVVGELMKAQANGLPLGQFLGSRN